MKISKIAHKININSKRNSKYKNFISNFFLNPANYFNQCCDGEPFCYGKFYTQLNEELPYNLLLKKNIKHGFLLPLIKKKKTKNERRKKNFSFSNQEQKEIIHNQEINLIFQKHENRIKRNKKEEIYNNENQSFLKNSFDKKLNHLLFKKQKNRFESFKKFEENINKLENKLVKIIKRPKSQLLIFYNNGQEKFRIKKEEREDSNIYHKDEFDKMNFHFENYLRTEKNFIKDIENIKKNKLYIRKPNIPIPNNHLHYKLKKNKTEKKLPKIETKFKRNLSGLFINGESLLKWEKDLIGKMKEKKYIYRPPHKIENFSPNLSKRTISLNSSYRSNLLTHNFSVINNVKEDLFN